MTESMCIEPSPQDEQKERLELFLTELMLITRRYGILLQDIDETIQFVDLASGNLIGLGLALFTASDDPAKVIAYEASDSILDGVWPMDGPGGPVDQRHVQNVFPLRETLPD